MNRRVLMFTDLEMADPRIPRIVKRLPAEGWPVTMVIPKPSKPIEDMFLMDLQALNGIGVEIIEIDRSTGHDDVPARDRWQGFKKYAADFLARPGLNRLDAFLRKKYWRAYVTMNYPEPGVKWMENAYPVLREQLASRKATVLWTSSSPVSVNMIASDLKREFGVPWIAEFRDLWSLNHNSPFGPLMRAMDRRLERKTMRNVDAMVTVTEEWAQKLKTLHRTDNVSYIPIACDRSESPADVMLTPDFTLTYTGIYYEGKQDPFIVLEAVKDLVAAGEIDRDKVRIRFYGTNDLAIRRFAHENGIDDLVLMYPRVKREDSLRRQAESQVLLYFNWGDERERGVCSLKLIEYLFSGRPILLTGGVPDNLMASIVKDTKGGVLVIDKEDAKRVLKDMYNDYLQSGSVPCETIPEAIEQFDVANSVRSYVQLFFRCLKPP